MTPSELSKLQDYLRKTLSARTLVVRARPQKNDRADVFMGDKPIAEIIVDDEDDELTYQFEMKIREQPQPLTATELVRIQTFLRERFGAKTLSVRARGKLKDSAEVFIGDESIATISVAKDGYEFQMAILDIDLDPVED
jgi:hypothetical protein